MRLFLILILLSCNLYSQVEYSQDRGKGQMLPRFFIELASYASVDPGKTKMDVFIKVPYSNVQFLRDQSNYKADYSLIVSIYNDDEDLILEKLWNEKVTTQTFDQTVSRTSFNIKSFSTFRK